MRLQLLGTAAAQGWPQPVCSCASCRSAQHNPRRPTEVLVDGLTRLGARPSVAELASGWHSRPLAAAEHRDASPVAVLLRSPAGIRLLHTTVSAPVSETALIGAVTLATVGVVVLAQGDATLDEMAAEVARLRRSQALAPDAAFVLVDLGHQNPPEPEFSAVAAAWGVTVGRDGAELVIDSASPHDGEPSGTPNQPRDRGFQARTLVIGGTRSGKSRWAEQQLAADPEVSYVATALEREDPDWADRIAVHRNRRPPHWNTVATQQLAQLLGSTAPGRSLLIDDLGNWVAGRIDASDGWDGDRAGFHVEAGALVDAWRHFTGRAVLVSNDVGAGVHPATRAGRVFADEIGALNSALAAQSDEVVVVSAGLARWLRARTGTIEP